MYRLLRKECRGSRLFVAPIAYSRYVEKNIIELDIRFSRDIFGSFRLT